MLPFNIDDKVTVIQPKSHYHLRNGIIKDFTWKSIYQYGIQLVPGDSTILWFSGQELELRTT